MIVTLRCDFTQGSNATADVIRKMGQSRLSPIFPSRFSPHPFAARTGHPLLCWCPEGERPGPRPGMSAGFRSHLRNCYKHSFELGRRHDAGVDNLLPRE